MDLQFFNEFKHHLGEKYKYRFSPHIYSVALPDEPQQGQN